MNNLPDDLRALEANLSELVPASLLDTDRLIFEAGYAAAIAERPSPSRSGQTWATMLGSALAGVAATLLIVAMRPDAAPAPPIETITSNAPAQTEPPSPPSVDQSSRLAFDRSRDSSRRRVRSNTEAQSDPTDLSYSTLRWRERLLQSDGQRPNTLGAQPFAFPSNSSIRESHRDPPTNLQWQRELIRDVPSSMRVNT